MDAIFSWVYAEFQLSSQIYCKMAIAKVLSLRLQKWEFAKQRFITVAASIFFTHSLSVMQGWNLKEKSRDPLRDLPVQSLRFTQVLVVSLLVHSRQRENSSRGVVEEMRITMLCVCQQSVPSSCGGILTLDFSIAVYCSSTKKALCE